MKITIPVMDRCLQKWTRSAIDCYKIGCDCEKCDLPKIYSSLKHDNCTMKAVVLGLVRKFGKPKREV